MRIAAGLAHAVAPGDAREQARDILRQRRFRTEDVPRPFEGVLRWLGERLEPIGRLLDPVFDFFTSPVGAFIALAALVAAIAFVAAKVARRRGVSAAGAGRPATEPPETIDPEALDREADAAERAGDLERALRLRFRAGLLRLDRAGAIRYRPSLTSGQVSQSLHLSSFDELARTFEGVAYGGAPARADDLLAARRDWPRTISEAG